MLISWFVASLATHAQVPTLTEIETRSAAYPGVQIEAEMKSPSVVPMSFRISPEGLFWAKYPTSEMYITPKETITWMPARKEYARVPNSEGNPCPVGFHSMWPVSTDTYKQVGTTSEAEFFGTPSYQLTIKGSADYNINLFVDRSTWMPVGTRVLLNGTTYEMQYKQVKIGPILRSLVTFKPPTGAKVATQRTPDASLIKPGSRLAPFSGKDLAGKTLSVQKLMQRHSKGLVLNFWFSSCTGCVQEMPFLAKIHPTLTKQGIGLVGVNPIDDIKSAKGTSLKNQLGYPTLIGKGAVGLQKQVSVEAYPVTVILDPRSKVVDAFMGFDESRLAKAVAKLGAKL